MVGMNALETSYHLLGLITSVGVILVVLSREMSETSWMHRSFASKWMRAIVVLCCFALMVSSAMRMLAAQSLF
jgi:hypothetical protein